MSYLAKIIGISGCELYLDKLGDEVTDKKHAKRFRSEKSAEEAATTHLADFPRCVRKNMTFQVVHADTSAEAAHAAAAEPSSSNELAPEQDATSEGTP